MIYYFSGTGNSRYCAHSLANLTGDSTIFISSGTTCNDMNPDVFGLVFPVYSWGVPSLVLDFISRLPDGFRPGYSYAVFCCGDETGNAPRMLVSALRRKGFLVNAMVSVIMPNNYVLLPGFNVDTAVVRDVKLEKVPGRLSEIAEWINARDCVQDYFTGSFPRLKTAIVYPLFRRWGVIRKLWRVKSSCVKCGLCADRCPVKNITMTETGPVFGHECVSCLSCYHSCPSRSIRYGSFTARKGQYMHPYKGVSDK